jgi:hypothetical protein
VSQPAVHQAWGDPSRQGLGGSNGAISGNDVRPALKPGNPVWTQEKAQDKPALFRVDGRTEEDVPGLEARVPEKNVSRNTVGLDEGLGKRKTKTKQRDRKTMGGGVRMMRKRLEPLFAHRPILGSCTCNSYLPSVWLRRKTKGEGAPGKYSPNLKPNLSTGRTSPPAIKSYGAREEDPGRFSKPPDKGTRARHSWTTEVG